MDRTEKMNQDTGTGAMKASKMARMDLLPWGALWEVAELYGAGAEKYSAHNWRKGYDWSYSFQALMRHAALFWEGEEDDPETGCPHMTAVVFHALALLTFAHEHPDGDDRPATLGAVGPAARGEELEASFDVRISDEANDWLARVLERVGIVPVAGPK
jgi:hypothetical protein